MKTWRVGTISMGLLLIFLGVFLVLAQWFEWKAAYAMSGWWPLILVVLGIEIIVYLSRSKQEHPTVKYDLFSIFFIGFIGLVAIGFASFQAAGLLDKFHDWANVEVQTFDLPTVDMALDKNIKRVVVDAGVIPLTIETGTANEFSVFGTYQTAVLHGKAPIEKTEDFLFAERNGDTLFVVLKPMPEAWQPFDSQRIWKATMIVPDNVQLDIKTDGEPIEVHARTMNNDWTIENASEVNVKLAGDLDVQIHAEKVADLDESDGWEAAAGTEEDSYFQSGKRQFGKGTHVMKIMNASIIAVSESK